MMKTKSVHESTLREMQRQSNGNLSRLNKSKETREVRKKAQPAPPQLTSIASISSKRLHKPSRSTIEPNEQLHYNSPILAYPQNENIQTNTFSFTHILQQNLKSQHSQMSLENHIPPPVTSFQLNQEPKSISIAITNRSQQKAQHNDDILLKNGILSKDKIAIQKEHNHQKGNSIERSVSKSPLRAVNMNKINNTPKIKQYRKEKDVQKSFKNALQNKENKQNQQIRFQCSEKIFKFMQNVKMEGLSLNRKDFINGEKSKSNLLSTGIINLSQRLDHDKLPSELIKTSKGNLFNRSIAESSSNEIKQFFDEDSSPNSEVFLEDEVAQLKQKIMKNNYQLQRLKSNKRLMNNLQDLLSNSYNPEISFQKSNETIKKLTNLKTLIIETVEDIVESTAKLSRSFVRQIDECIKNVEASCKTNINWVKIQEQLRNHDKFQSIKCQNEILMERIRKIQEEIHQSNALSEKISNFSINKTQIESQLKDINLKITKISHSEINASFQCALDRSYYSIFFQTLFTKFQRLRSIITQSDVFSK